MFKITKILNAEVSSFEIFNWFVVIGQLFRNTKQHNVVRKKISIRLFVGNRLALNRNHICKSHVVLFIALYSSSAF